ncbi:tRNA pseudouridine(38-40) synthase TruA [Sulfurimonas paralvinellae]|uniref:tRNA pseudouridine synthase A n=1 Tax=Sulfurimonas paralvinellae TaxID=317658 RepID=A0A7M1B7B5_9BACT|nr:tRNA pseudouridine(38-40) synthase TruA [Sulfurimonas paralvinellae]QOP45570.1 tRNA pseudouridine(38-40) synthase TruA [Sulfurimonas paralvinellae]
MRVAVTLAYNGTHYLGSQVQRDFTNTIFGVFEKALKELGIEQRVIASGRTDKGVHATGQVCHFDLPPYWTDTTKLKRVLNFMLPSSIRVRMVKEVNDDFHARYSTKKRVYRYIIKNSAVTPFEADFVTSITKKINIASLNKKMQHFIGEHDFKHFKKNGSDEKTTVRFIYKAFAYKHKGYIILNFEANGFLRSQIRMMVGSLFKLTEEQLLQKLTHTNHKVDSAPPNGLYLAKIKY